MNSQKKKSLVDFTHFFVTVTKLTAHIMTDMYELDLDDDALPFPPDRAELSTKLDL